MDTGCVVSTALVETDALVGAVVVSGTALELGWVVDDSASVVDVGVGTMLDVDAELTGVLDVASELAGAVDSDVGGVEAGAVGLGDAVELGGTTLMDEEPISVDVAIGETDSTGVVVVASSSDAVITERDAGSVPVVETDPPGVAAVASSRDVDITERDSGTVPIV